MSTKKASTHDAKIIRDIALATWYVTYGPTHSRAQLDYMIEKFYSVEALEQSISEMEYYIYEEENRPSGFISLEHHFDNKNTTKIHRIYLLPEYQGKGIGKTLIDYAATIAQLNQSTNLLLNVNRENKAQFFYEKLGFKVLKTEDIPIGNGYLMEDFVMGKKIGN
jgi:diamine N-acetyltransferase